MPIHHIILIKFKEGITPEEIGQFQTSIGALPSLIPAISDVKAGRKIKHPLDRDYDQGVIFIFKDESALREYIDHQAHWDYQKFTKPFVQDKFIFDLYTDE